VDQAGCAPLRRACRMARSSRSPTSADLPELPKPYAGADQALEHELPKLVTGVRFPSPALQFSVSLRSSDRPSASFCGCRRLPLFAVLFQPPAAQPRPQLIGLAMHICSVRKPA
jgi:hypothetical protein